MHYRFVNPTKARNQEGDGGVRWHNCPPVYIELHSKTEPTNQAESDNHSPCRNNHKSPSKGKTPIHQRVRKAAGFQQGLRRPIVLRLNRHALEIVTQIVLPYC